MIGSSFYALQHVGVAMVTVWKNVSNFVTAVCDVTIYKKSYSTQVGECLLELPVLSACSNPQMPVAAVWDVTKLYARTFVVGV
jgi:GDP-mannose transporter